MSELAVQSSQLDIHSMSYADLDSGFDSFLTIPGHDLIGKEYLLGVPHIITGVRYQEVPPADKKGERQRGYVTVEATVGDEAALNRQLTLKRIVHLQSDGTSIVPQTLDDLAVAPNDRIVYNDGSTGVRRQLTELFSRLGIIDVGPSDAGANPMDKPWDSWARIDDVHKQMQGEYSVPYFTTTDGVRPLILKARRGLRVSRYESDFGDAATFYL